MKTNLYYTYEKPYVSSLVLVRNRLAGWLDRKSVLNQFMLDNNITSIHGQGHAVTRSKYNIRTQHVEFLAHIRDRELLRESARPRIIRENLTNEIYAYHGILDRERDKLTSLQEELAAVKKQLTTTDLSPLQKAHYQGDRGTIEASIKNQKYILTDISKTIDTYESILKQNSEMFQDYRKDLRNTYDMVLNSYVKVVGRKLNKIGFTKYDAEMRDFDTDIDNQVKEMVNGK